MKYLVQAVVLFTLLLNSPHVTGAQDNASLDGLNRLSQPSHSPTVLRALKEFEQAESSDFRNEKAVELMELAATALSENRSLQAVDIARIVFLSTVGGETRQRAFNILNENASPHLATHVSEIIVIVKNVSCYGRFHDSLNQSVRDSVDWIHKIEIRDTHRVQKRTPSSGLIIGTIAELKFTIDRSKNPQDLADVLRKINGKAVDGWEILVPVRLAEILD